MLVNSFPFHVLNEEWSSTVVGSTVRALPPCITKLLWGQSWRTLFFKAYRERVVWLFLKQEID